VLPGFPFLAPFIVRGYGTRPFLSEAPPGSPFLFFFPLVLPPVLLSFFFRIYFLDSPPTFRLFKDCNCALFFFCGSGLLSPPSLPHGSALFLYFTVTGPYRLCVFIGPFTVSPFLFSKIGITQCAFLPVSWFLGFSRPSRFYKLLYENVAEELPIPIFSSLVKKPIFPSSLSASPLPSCFFFFRKQ